MFEMMSVLADLDQKVYPIVDKVDKYMAMSMVCMLIDYIGAKYGIEPVAIVDEIRPIIAEVNESMGKMKIA